MIAARMVEGVVIEICGNTGIEICGNTGSEIWATGSEIWATGSEIWATGIEIWATGIEIRAPHWIEIWATGMIEAVVFVVACCSSTKIIITRKCQSVTLLSITLLNITLLNFCFPCAFGSITNTLLTL
jgi:hypothetical protein